MVTDNGPTFVSMEFQEFMQKNGVKHTTSAPYHPSTNGLAERGVQSVKKALKTTEGATLQEKLSKFLFRYQITPHTTTGIAPSELLMSRRLRSRLDLVVPSVRRRVEGHQLKQKSYHDNSKPLRCFEVGDPVFVEDFRVSKSKWIAGNVVRVTGPLSYEVELLTGGTVRQHVDNIRQRHVCPSSDDHPFDDLVITVVDTTEPMNQDITSTSSNGQVEPPSPPPTAPTVRRSGRRTQPPDRYAPMVRT